MPTSLHIVGSKTLGGAERFYLRLIEALHEGGVSVEAMLRAGSEVVPQVPAGIPVHQSPMRTVWDPVSRRAITLALRAIRPAIVQTYMGRATRLTHVRPGHGPVHVSRLGGYYKLAGYHHAHAWIGNTRGVCDYLIQGGMPARRVYHISNFIDPPRPVAAEELAALRRELGIPQEALVVVTAGRFVPVKGHQYLLGAFAHLPAAVHDRPLWLLLVGDGPLRPELEAQARGLGVTERVAWAGWRTDPSPCYQASDLVAFPSLELETLGNVILEAWSHGKPLVTSRFRGAREITHHEEDAWQVECEDEAGLAQGILHVLHDDVLAADLVRHGSDHLAREFSRTAVVRRYLDLYDELLTAEG
jgi:hypothetical protein